MNMHLFLGLSALLWRQLMQPHWFSSLYWQGCISCFSFDQEIYKIFWDSVVVRDTTKSDWTLEILISHFEQCLPCCFLHLVLLVPCYILYLVFICNLLLFAPCITCTLLYFVPCIYLYLACSVSRWRPQKVDKRMVLEYTHGLFIT